MQDDTEKWKSPHGHPIASSETDDLPQVSGTVALETDSGVAVDTQKPNAALDALEELSHVRMELSIADWSRISRTIQDALTRQPEPVNAQLLEALKGWMSHYEGFSEVELSKRCDPATLRRIAMSRQAIAAAEAQLAQTVVEGLEGAVERWLVDGCICPNQEDMMTVLEAARAYLALTKREGV